MPHPTDVHVGQRVRQARLARKMSQTALGRALGVSFQQVQKYESGVNRIGSSRLWDISSLLETPVSFFFDGLKAKGRKSPEEPALNRQSLELARTIEQLPDGDVKKRFVRLIEACVRARKA